MPERTNVIQFFLLTVLGFAYLTSASAGCGCFFDPPGTPYDPDMSNLFTAELGELDPATLHWKGKSYNLKLISKDEARESKPGSKSVYLYDGVAAPIQVKVTTTEQEPTCFGSECESTPYGVEISISRDGRTEIVAAEGECGC